MANVTFDEERRRYEIFSEDELAGFAEYADRGDYLDFHRTVIYERFGGQGLAGQVVRHALDDVRAHGKKIKPTCSFVDGFIKKNPEYQDLVFSPAG